MNPGNVVPYGMKNHEMKLAGGIEAYERQLATSNFAKGVAVTLGTEAAIRAIGLAASPAAREAVGKKLSSVSEKVGSVMPRLRHRSTVEEIRAAHQKAQ